MNLYPISIFNQANFKKFLIAAIGKNEDILACFDHGELSGDHIQGGHVCVVDRLDLKNGTIRLIDPQQSQPKWRIVKISRLFKAMQFHGDANYGGLWGFKKIGSNIVPSCALVF